MPTFEHNNKERMPYEHYTALLAQMDPIEISARCGLDWDGQWLSVPLMGQTLRVRLPDFGSFGAKGALASIYTPVTVFLSFFVWLIALSLVLGGVQFFCLASIILIACYSGQRGKHSLKGLFYVFYPAHLAVLGAIYLILNPDFLSTLF